MKILIFVAFLPFIFGQLALVSNDVLQIPVNSQYSYTLSATGGQTPYTYNATGLPAGITLSGNTISGLSSVAGVFSAVLTVTDAAKASANKTIFVYVTSPNGASNTQNTNVTTITTTTTQSTTGTSGLSGAVILPISTSSTTQGTSLNQNSSVATVSATGVQSGSAAGLLATASGLRTPQTTSGSTLSTSGSFTTGSASSFTNPTQPTFNQNFNPNAFVGVPQTQSISGPIQISLSGLNPQVPNSLPSNNFPTQNLPNPSGVLIVPTTTPYITNYSFASSLQSTPTVSTQSTESVFQRQTNVNRAISNLLSLIQNYNATLLSIQNNIPNTTSLLNDAIRNQRVAQAQVNSIINQNNTITNNISAIESGIKTLQNQVLSTTSTLNNSQAQIQTFQTRITQNYIQINDTQNRINQANSSLQDAQRRQNTTEAVIGRSRDIILGLTQKITTTQNDINNSPAQLERLTQALNRQKSVILVLQKQLKDAILALEPIQGEFDYYTMIPTLGPGFIQQNKTLLLGESTNLAQAQPFYESALNDVQTFTNQISQLTTSINSLQNQLSADRLAYDNLVGSQNNQEGLFNNTLITIATQTQLLNKMKQQQSELMIGPYNAALQVVSDTTSKVNQLTQTVQSLNQRYQSVQKDIATTQQSLSEALVQKDIADQAVNQAISSGGGSIANAALSSFSSTPSANNVIANITISGSV